MADLDKDELYNFDAMKQSVRPAKKYNKAEAEEDLAYQLRGIKDLYDFSFSEANEDSSIWDYNYSEPGFPTGYSL
jgi:hypothetical protein